jgi:hypothetical protein
VIILETPLKWSGIVSDQVPMDIMLFMGFDVQIGYP